MISITSKLTAAAVVLLLVAAGCQRQDVDPPQTKTVSDPLGPRAGIGGNTPEAAFQGFRAAVVAGDWSTALLYLTPESRDFLVGNILRGLDMGAYGADRRKLALKFTKDDRLKAAVEKVNRLPKSQQRTAVAKLAKLVEDKPKLMAEFMTIARADGTENWMLELKQCNLTDVRIDGDTASARVTLSSPNSTGSEDTRLRKIDGRWYVDYQSRTRRELRK